MSQQRNPIDYTPDELQRTALTMHRFGGSFAHHIAEAFMVADKINRATLLTAFAGLFHKYGPESDFQRRN